MSFVVEGSDPLEATTLASGEVAPTAGEPVWVPGLTVLHHPDEGRVGDCVALTTLAAGRAVGLSRLEPTFSPASGSPPTRRGVQPLGLPNLSRRPVWLRPLPGSGGLEIDPTESSIRLEVDGTWLDRARSLAPREVEGGVVLTLARSVVLLLHPVDPLGSSSTPRWGLLGDGLAMSALREQIPDAAASDLPVLIRGETGVGKELVARALHDAGRRAGGPFVAVDMGALAPSLAASELFGAVKGAFTGADRTREGLFRRADGGTLFLDEIGETPPEVQVTLLRALESGVVRPVGGGSERRADVRIVAATDTDLGEAVDDGRFRAPLLHRLAVIPLEVPPLRRRREDLGVLLHHFLHASEAAGARPSLDAALVARLAAYDWPGNVRQLRNVAHRLVLAARGGNDRRSAARLARVVASLPASPNVQESPSRSAVPGTVRRRTPADVTEDEMVSALQACAWRPAKAAARLGISRPSLYNLMRDSPRVRIASDLDEAAIETAREATGDDLDEMARRLRVSRRALARRLSGDERS